MSQQSPIWKKLSPDLRHFFGPFSMRGNEFLIVSVRKNRINISNYNTKVNKWTNMVDLHHEIDNEDFTAAFDRPNQLVYISGWSNLYQIDLKRKAIELSSKHDSIIEFPAMTIVNDKIHILNQSGIHLIYDASDKSITKIHEFTNRFYIQFTLHMKSRNSILMFVHMKSSDSDLIYEFSLENKEWHQWNLELPTQLPIYSAAILTSTDEKYLFFLGGIITHGDTNIIDYDDEEYCDKISVLDVQNEVLRNCSITCPTKGQFGALIMNNEEEDELLVFGYVNQLYRLTCFTNVQKMPDCIILLIRKFVCKEFIHLIQRIEGTGQWDINIDDIICSLI